DILGEGNIRFVGGAVRDAIIMLPVKDIDIATILTPEEVTKRLTHHKIKVIPTGINHGTVTAVFGEHSFEITTLRSDVSTDGRRAVVSYTTDWEEDAKRRDFTINALYCDENGKIIDYFSGIADVLNGRIKFIGDANECINEDALRILRFFRFNASHGKGEFDEAGLYACSKNAKKINILSGERIREEMFKLFLAKDNAKIIDEMQKSGVLKYIIPYKIDVLSLSRLDFSLYQPVQIKKEIVILALLIRSCDSDALKIAEIINERWKLSKRDYNNLLNLSIDKKNLQENLQKNIRLLGKEIFSLHVLMNIAEGEDREMALKAIEFCNNWEIPIFPIKAEILLERGIKADKNLGILLRKMENFWEDSGYNVSIDEILSVVI
ncbi:MAG: CCA tRNA nucleotidyltransferase, partial [Pseudomonadota bacterium]